MIEIGSVLRIVQDGGPDVILLLLVFLMLFLTDQISPKSAIEYRDRQIKYREDIIGQQDDAIKRQQDLFDQTVKTIREHFLPLLGRGGEFR